MPGHRPRDASYPKDAKRRSHVSSYCDRGYGTDQPRYVSDTIVNFVRRVKGRQALADINLGNEGIWKGDEALLIEDLRALHGVNGG